MTDQEEWIIIKKFCKHYFPFSDLSWILIKERHQTAWDKLKTSYDLTPSVGQEDVTIEQIAVNCVNACWEYLLPQSAPDEFSPKEIEEKANLHLRKAMVDHLVTSFAYHFYCDNLQPKNIRDYSNILFDYTYMGQASSENHAEAIYSNTESRSTFCSNMAKSYQDWIQDVRATLKFCQDRLDDQVLPPLSFHPDDALLPPNWAFSFASAKMRTLKGPYEICRTPFETFYFVSFMANKKRQPEVTLAEKLTSFLTKNDYIPLLVKQEPRKTCFVYTSYWPASESTEPPLLLELREAVSSPEEPERRSVTIAHARTEDPEKRETIMYEVSGYPLKPLSSPFTALPWEARNLFDVVPLPEQSYLPKDKLCDHDIMISQELQLLFNSYLLESNYHGHALANILNCLFRHPPGEIVPTNIESYLTLLAMASRVHTPISHAAFIQFIDDVISWRVSKIENVDFGNKILKWGNQYIDHLNTFGLPILEEYFLWSVFETLPSAQQVFSATDRSFFCDGRFCREDLLLFRLIPLEHYRPLSETFKEHKQAASDRLEKQRIKAITSALNFAAQRTFLSAINFYCPQIKRDTSPPITFPVDVADQNTVFD